MGFLQARDVQRLKAVAPLVPTAFIISSQWGGGGGKEWEVLRMLLNLPGSGRKSSLGSVGKSLDELLNPTPNCGHVPACDGLGTDLQPVLAWSPVGNFGLFSREIVLPWDTPGVFLILPSL